MINVQKNKDIYEIIIHADMSDVKLEDNLINITVDTKKHMYYIALPNQKRKNESVKVIKDIINRDLFSKFILNKISKDPSKLGMSGKTKTYEKDILREIFNELGIDIICQKDNVLEKDVKIYNFRMNPELDIFNKR